MSTVNEKAVAKDTGESFEIILDDSEKDTYKVILPLTYDFEFSPLDEKEKGGDVRIASMEVRDTRTFVNVKVSRNARPWKFRVINPVDRSSLDEDGSTQTGGQNEGGDGIDKIVTKHVDLLVGKKTKLDDDTKEFVSAVRNARREIIITREIV